MNIKFNVNKEPNNSYKVEVTVDRESVQKRLDEALKHEAENFEIKGFRKGSVPLNMVKEHMDPARIRSHALNHMIPEIYKQLLNEHKFNPIIGPRIELREFDEGQDLVLSIIIVEKPEIIIGDYKKALQELKEEKAKKETENEEDKKVTNSEAIDKVLEISEVKTADIIIQEEVTRMMSSLLDQTSKLGITIDQYLEAHKKNLQEIKDDYKKNAERTIKADFIISEIALAEKITVTDEEVQQTISIIPDEASRKQFENPEQRMYVKAIMLKAKTLEKLVDIANA
jgi:FKBP-type peptidyl-prolyl cis-trans isomerase (trigger factor)